MEECRLSVVHRDGASIVPGEIIASVEEARARVIGVVESTLVSLQSIFAKAGYAETDQATYLMDMSLRIKAVCESELEAENKILDLGRQQVEAFEEERTALLTHLGRPTPTAYPAVADDYNSILNALKYQLELLREEHATRLGQLDDKRADLIQVAALLGVPVAVDDQSARDVSDEAFARFDAVMESLLEVKTQRERKLAHVLQECYSIYAEFDLFELGFDTLPDHEVYAAIDASIVTYFRHRGPMPFTVHASSLSVAERRLKDLVFEREQRRDELALLGECIAKLWNHLKVNAAEREAFQMSFDMKLSVRTIAVGNAELARLRRIRSASMAQLVFELRSAVEKLWGDMHLGQDERRQELPTFFVAVEDLDDCAIDEHERYYEDLAERHKSLAPILLKIQSREAIVEDRIELERIQLNPDRLKNRGASAFAERKKEEAMIKGIRTLEKLTEDIQGMIMEWEQQHGGVFRYEGTPYQTRVATQEGVYHEIRSTIRQLRTQRREVKTPGTASKHKALDSSFLSEDGFTSENDLNASFEETVVASATKKVRR